MKIAFIGGGNMGEAMLAAILSEKICAPGDITIGEVREERRAYLKDKYLVNVTVENRDAVVGKDVVIMAVKPQTLPDVMAALKGCLQPGQLVLSIIAGVTIGALSLGLDHGCVVRVMPNTPAQVGAGMSAWTAATEVSEVQKNSTRALLGAMGKEIYFEDEEYINMATAVSGSGPAYFFLLAEALVEAGVNIGLSRADAEVMATQTMSGAAKLMQESGKTPAELRKNVTSPGGTTAAAIQTFEIGGFLDLTAKAVAAAYKRAQELAN
jgi:pyrroline-5-carboxylate reductase